MIERIYKTICENKMLTRGECVVCGLSGGADSIAMLITLGILADRLQITVTAAHLNHCLRGDESLRDEKFVRDFCKERNIPLYCERIDVKSFGSSEETARILRYEFFDRAAKALGGNKIATAHHANDNMETMIFHLVRGTGLIGLCGIPPVRGRIIRPMLDTTREEIEAFLKEKHIKWMDDSTNAVCDFSRNLIRNNVIPTLLCLNKRAVENSSRTAKILRQDDTALSMAAHRWLESQPQGSLSIETANLPEAIAHRVVRLWVEKVVYCKKYTLEFRNICDIITLMRNASPSARIHLPGGFVVYRLYQYIRIKDCDEKKTFAPIYINEGESTTVSGFVISCLRGSAVVRPRKSGDVLKIPGRCEKTLKKLFIELKIPRHEREMVPVVVREDQVIAVCGIGFDERIPAGDIRIEKEES